jgi:quinolinate synthase
MYRIGLPHLRDVLAGLAAGAPEVEEHRIVIADEVRAGARAALERMLALP